MKDAIIHSKRGIWYVTRPGHDVRMFDNEASALAYISGKTVIEPDDFDEDDDEEYYEE